MPVPARSSTPRRAASLARALGTAPVPPRGYQTPSLVCMCAMPHSTAGDGSGAEPTYCVKWSSIWATRWSGTWDAHRWATLRPSFMLSTSASMAGLNIVFRSNMSQIEPMDRQKKKRSEISCRRLEKSRKRR